MTILFNDWMNELPDGWLFKWLFPASIILGLLVILITSIMWAIGFKTHKHANRFLTGKTLDMHNAGMELEGFEINNIDTGIWVKSSEELPPLAENVLIKSKDGKQTYVIRHGDKYFLPDYSEELHTPFKWYKK